MSGTTETEMQIQIMTYGEAFCPSTMTKEILSKNQKRMMVTEMQKGPTEENEIKEGQEKVEEELGNEKKESTFSSPWKFCPNLLYEERGQMDENKIKERQEEEQEEQGNKRVMYRRQAYIHLVVLTPWEIPFANRKLLREEITNNERNEMEEGQMEENEIKEGHDNVEEEQDNKTKETPFASRKLLREEITNNERNEMEEGQMEENEIKERHDDVEEEQDNENATRSALSASYWPGYTCDFLMEEAQMEEYNKKERQKKMKAILKELRLLNLEFAVSAQKELKQAIVEMWIRRLEIENFWKHALGKDMNIMRILKSGSLRFLKQQIQDVWQLLRCKVCLDSDACMVFFPCRHMATCEYCGSFLDQCPVCRTFIEETVKVNKK